MNTRDRNRTDGMLATATSRRQAVKLMGGGLVGGLAMATGIKGISAQGRKVQGEWELGAYTFDGTEEPLEGSTVGIDDFVGETVEFVPRHFYKDGDTLRLAGDVLLGEDVGAFDALVPLEDIIVAGTHNEMASVVGGRASDVYPAQAGGECEILTLNIAPIFLDLLGLQVELPNPLVLEIRAVEGAGNLLGNLLCAVAGLLDGNSPTGGLAGLLNNILRALGLA